MKLYLQDDEIIFDYSDVDFKENTLNNKGYAMYREFMMNCNCEWEYTLRKQVRRMVCKKQDWLTEYGNIARIRNAVASCYYTAQRLYLIEISDDIKQYLDKLQEQCDELREAERIREQRERAEAEAKALWKAKCEHGCGRCPNLRRCDDDFKCMATEEYLNEKNVRGYVGNTYLLFNWVPFPTDNCPFNINKIKEEAV